MPVIKLYTGTMKSPAERQQRSVGWPRYMHQQNYSSNKKSRGNIVGQCMCSAVNCGFGSEDMHHFHTKLWFDWKATNEGLACQGVWLSTDDRPPAVSFIKSNA